MRRVFTRLIVFSLAGVASTLAVAALCGWFSPLSLDYAWRGWGNVGGSVFLVDNHEGFGCALVTWGRWSEARARGMESPDAATESARRPSVAPAWCGLWDPSRREPTAQSDMQRDCAAGWPFLALRGEWPFARVRTTGVWRVEGGVLRLPDRVTNFGFAGAGTRVAARWIPLRPIWSGLAADAAIYAAAWWGLAWGVGRLRTRIRVKAGLCPHCRYDLRGLPVAAVCPECGASPRSASGPAT